MSYIDKALMTGETLQYRAHRHWIIFSAPCVLLPLGVAIHVYLTIRVGNGIASGGPLGMLVILELFAFIGGLWSGIESLIARYASEFGITNKRVIVKVGWLRKHRLEAQLPDVERIDVMQNLEGRIFNHGTIIIKVTGDSSKAFDHVAAPYEFLKVAQEQTLAARGVE